MMYASVDFLESAGRVVGDAGRFGAGIPARVTCKTPVVPH